MQIHEELALDVVNCKSSKVLFVESTRARKPLSVSNALVVFVLFVRKFPRTFFFSFFFFFLVGIAPLFYSDQKNRKNKGD